ncbi:MAG: hypothetical protein ACI4US_03890 [Muribaculaceae bacterium]
MKKLLLFAAAATMVSASFAQDAPSELKMTTQWAKTRVNGGWALDKLPAEAAGLFTGANLTSRTAAVTDKYVVVGFSDNTENYNVFLALFNKETGEHVKNVAVTCDGAQIAAQWAMACMGTDYAGNVYFGDLFLDEAKSVRHIYYMSDLEAGTAVKVGDFTISEDEASAGVRHDYFDVAGDITRETMPCVIMSASSTGGEQAAVWGIRCEQGGTEWTGQMAGGDYTVLPITDLGDDGKTVLFGGSTVLKMVYNEDPEQMGSLFYVDGQNTAPLLYDTDGILQDKLDPAADPCPEQVGSNGINDFTLGNDLYFAYACQQNDTRTYAERLGRLMITKASAEGKLAGCTLVGKYPEEGLGGFINSGVWNHTIVPEVIEEGGNPVCYITHFIAANGLARYRFGAEGAGVNDVVADDVNAPVVYYNLQGMQISNPEAGQLVIKKQGKSAKKVLAL